MLTVKLDTGAEVSVLPMHLYNKLQVKPSSTQNHACTSMKLSAYTQPCSGPAFLNTHVSLMDVLQDVLPQGRWYYNTVVYEDQVVSAA